MLSTIFSRPSSMVSSSSREMPRQRHSRRRRICSSIRRLMSRAFGVRRISFFRSSSGTCRMVMYPFCFSPFRELVMAALETPVSSAVRLLRKFQQIVQHMALGGGDFGTAQGLSFVLIQKNIGLFQQADQAVIGHVSFTHSFPMSAADSGGKQLGRKNVAG